MIKITEKVIQSLLIDWSMQRGGCQAACPNVTRDAHPRVIDWEADLLTVNRSGYLSEYEIKCSKSDYLKDSQKVFKMQSLLEAHAHYGKRLPHPEKIPNYFYYVTLFEIDPPQWAGWIRIEPMLYSSKFSLLVVIEKRAPLLHSGRVGESQIDTLARLLSYRLSHSYRELYPYTEKFKDKD